MGRPIYLDHHATTPVDPRVLETMLPFFSEHFGNAASRNHRYGWDAEKAVASAREQVANLIGASPREIFFTSGATESNNLAIKGAAERHASRGRHIVTCVTEHRAVLDVCRRLERYGFRVTYLPVDSSGRLDPETVRDALADDTCLISLMSANNEIGVLQPIREIGVIARDRGVLFHVDAAQAAGKIPVDVDKDCVDLLSLTAHKIYGPKGVGALFVRRRSPRAEIDGQIDGGGHERGLRSGTLNVPGIVGFGSACEIAAQEMAAEAARLGELRDCLWEGLSGNLDGVRLNGSREHRLPHNLNVSFDGVDGENLLLRLSEHLAVSSGSACTTSEPEPSHVLRAIGVPDRLAHASIRFGLGRSTSLDDISTAIAKTSEIVARLRTSPSPRTA